MHWFAFRTAARGEEAALEELAAFAGETRLPRGMREVRRRNGSVKKRSWPLLVGYAFAGFSSIGDLGRLAVWLDERRRRELRTAVRCVVATSSGAPLELRPDKQGRAWFETMDYSTVELPDGEQRPLGWGRGDQVRITEGPLAGFVFPVERVEGELASVVVDLFNSAYPLPIPVRHAVRFTEQGRRGPSRSEVSGRELRGQRPRRETRSGAAARSGDRARPATGEARTET